MTRPITTLGRVTVTAIVVVAALLFCAAPAPDAAAQAYCTTPGTPPFPPPPPKPPKPCAPYKCKNCSTSPCLVASGVYVAAELDLMVDTPSFPLMAARSYESNRAVDGAIGLGWTSSLTARIYYAAYLYSAPSTYTYQAELVTMSGTSLTFSRNADGTFTAPAGSRDRLVRNGDGTFDWYPEHKTSRVHFNADGTIQRVVDQFGNTLSYSYDGNGRVTRVQDDMGSGRYFDVGWGADGRISTITDNAGRVLRYEYGSDGVLTRVVNPLDQATTLTYTAGRFGPLLDSVKDHWNRTITELEWLEDDHLESYSEGEYTGPSSRGEKYVYQYFPTAANPYVIRSHSLGSTTHYYNRDTWIVQRAGTSVDASTGDVLAETDGAASTVYTYDSLGRRASMQKGNVHWKFTYDANFPEQVSSVIAYSNSAMTAVHPDWAGYHYVYAAPGTNAAGSLTEVQQVRTDGTTREWIARYGYDARGRTISTSDVDGFGTTYGYDASGDLTTVTTPTGTTTVVYDNLGRVTSVTNEMGQVKSFTYDALGRTLTETLPRPSPSSPPFVTTYTYDNFSSATGFTYTHVTDANGRTRKYGFDALGNQVQEIDELNHTTSYNYKYNLLDNITDANGNVTRYVYNSARTHYQTVYPNGGTETFNTSGSVVTSRTDRRGITTSYTYDGFSRPTAVTARQNAQVLESTTMSYTGQKLMSVSYQNGTSTETLTYTYDDAFRVLTETQGTRAKMTYGYHVATPSSRLRSYSVGAASGGTPTATATYTYDAKGRVQTIEWSKIAGAFSFTYNALDQYTQIRFPTGQKRVFTYDGQARLTSVSNDSSSGSPIVRYTYSWDYDWGTLANTMLGQISHVDVTANNNTGQPVGRTTYRYDAKYQLTRTDHPGGNHAAWTYDPIGNRLTAEATGSAATTYVYHLNAANRNTPRILSDGSTGNYVYDANGNYTGRDAFNTPHVYDAQNRLTDYGDRVEAVYDPNGRRIRSNVGSSVDKTFVYMGEQVIGEKTAGWNLDYAYLMGPGMDEPLAMTFTDGTVHYFAVDGQGSVLGLMAAASATTYSHAMQYSPFGRELASAAYNAPIYGYTGRERTTSRYWYYRYRYYDPLLGRFLSEDPIQEFVPVIGAAQYSYVSNAPTMFTDPYGLAQCDTKFKWGASHVEEVWTQDWALKSKWDEPKLLPIGPKNVLGKLLSWKKPNTLFTAAVTEYCLWVKYFASMKYLIKKWSLVTTCKCPDSQQVYDGEDKQILSQSVNKMGSAITHGTIGLGYYKPCKKPN